MIAILRLLATGMKSCCVMVSCLLALGLCAASDAAGQSAVATAPTLIPITGQIVTPTGEPRTGTVVLVLSLYDAREDTAPRWVEYQTVTLGADGSYDVQFGSTFDAGLPPDLFAGSTIVRWVGVGVENEPEQPRAMLVSVPYAAKAATADSLAGKTASDFVLTENLATEVRAALRGDSSTEGDVSTNAVTLNYLQKGDGLGGTTNSTLYEAGGMVGIGTTSPSAHLDVRSSGVNDGGKMGIGNIDGSDFVSFYGGQNNDARSALFWAAGNDFVYGTATAINGAGFVERMRVTNGGNVMLGGSLAVGHSSPSMKLDVRGSGVNDGGKMGIGNSDGSDFISFYGGQNNDARSIMFWAAGNDFVYGTASGLGGAGFAELMRVTSSGNVGIGTTSPTAKLHVAGNTTITGNVTIDGNIAAKYQDVAEWVDAAEPLEPGTVVVIDETASNRVTAANREYDSRVAGAVSPQPGLVLGEPGEGRVLVAQSGRVRIKADARYGAIKAGDIVVTSPTRGHAMRSAPVKVGKASMHRPGTVIGKALEPLATGTGEILVLLTLQ